MGNDKSILMGLPALLGICVLLIKMSYESTNIEYKIMYKKFALFFFLAFSAFGCVYIYHLLTEKIHINIEQLLMDKFNIFINAIKYTDIMYVKMVKATNL